MSETGTAPLEPGEQLGRYRLLKKIARGGMAEVFVARSFGAWGFEKTVAIKRILDKYGNDPAFIRMMVDEAKITVLLNHPNVAQIIELAEQDGDYFIVMEFVPGVSLSALAKRLRERNERVGVLEGCFIVTEALQGLHAAHEQRDQSGNAAHIIHRDVSPQNVLLSFDGHVKVIDFGIARARHRLEMTEVGTIKGKLRYLAPEMIDPLRFMKSGDFDHRVDVFAAGIVLWEQIANRTLYEGDDEMAVYDAITETNAPDLATLGLCDRPLADIVTRALARSPDDRYPTAEAFADDLRAYLYRSDPAFTHRRVAAVLTRHFPAEKDELLALERGAMSGPGPAAPAGAPVPGRASRVGQAAPPVAKAPVEPAKQESTSNVRRARKNVIDVGDARAPVNAPTVVAEMPRIDADERAEEGERILTVNTLVSRSDRRALPDAERASGPRVGAETVTVTGDARAALRARRHESGGTPAAPAGAVAPADDVAEASLPAALPLPVAEGTSSALSSSALSSSVLSSSVLSSGFTASTLEPAPGARTRYGTITGALRGSRFAPWLLAAATGIGIALIAIVVRETSRPAPLPPRVAPVPVVVSTNAAGAIVARAGVEQPAPAHFDALPGDAFEVVVKAPGYREQVRRIAVPRDTHVGLTVDVPLEAPPRTLAAKVAPSNAEVLVNDQPWTPDAAFPVGSIVMVQVSAPGFVAVRRELEVKPTEPLTVDVELRPEADAVKPVAAPDPDRDHAPDKRPKVERPKVERPAVVKKGTLKVKTKPFITEVTIDGQRQADTTPITVELLAGRHVVMVRHGATGQSKSATVTVKAGAVVEQAFTFDAR